MHDNLVATMSLSINHKFVATFVLAVIATLLFVVNFLPLENLLALIVFCVGLYALSEIDSHKKTLLISIWLITFILGFFASTHRPQGFSYPLIWEVDSLYPGGDSFELYANFAKAMCGYFIIIWLLGTVKTAGKFSTTYAVSLSLMSALALIGFAVVLFDLEAAYKLPTGILYFIVINLGITVVAEEAYFRLLLQAQIEKFFNHGILGKIIALVIASIIFAFSHTGAVGPAFVLFLIAGLIYGLVFTVTRSLSASIICHFSVNIMHFILFEYPLTMPG